jgi:oxygen-independent coproporphyrinogen-3 oxidase
MSADDRLRRDVINHIMCHGFVDVPRIERQHGIEFGGHFAREFVQLQRLEADGLVDLADGRIALTPVGRLLMRNVAMSFDAYIAAAERPPMSRVI